MAHPTSPEASRSPGRILVGDSASLAQALLAGLPADDARAVLGRLDGSGAGDHRARRRGGAHPAAPGSPSATYSSDELDRLAAEPWRGE